MRQKKYKFQVGDVVKDKDDLFHGDIIWPADYGVIIKITKDEEKYAPYGTYIKTYWIYWIVDNYVSGLNDRQITRVA